MMLSDLLPDTFVFIEVKRASKLKGSNMKNVILTLTALSIAALFSFSLATSSRIFVDDFDFDYSLDSLRTSASSYQGFSEGFDYDDANNQAENVPAYLYFDAVQPDGQLRLYISTSDRFNTDVPAIKVTVPDGAHSLSDLKGNIKLMTHSAKNIDTGLQVTFANTTPEDILSSYQTFMQNLNYQVSELSATGFEARLKDAAYTITVKEVGTSVQVMIKGL